MSVSALHLVRYGPSATGSLRAVIATAKSQDHLAPITVVVPSLYAGVSLRRELASSEGVVNVRFMVLHRLAEYLGAPALAAEGKAPLSPITELAIIREVGNLLTGQGPLGDVSRHPSLHASLSRSFKELDALTEDEISTLRNHDPLRSQIVDWHQEIISRTSDYYTRERLSRSAADSVNNGAVTSALRDLGTIILFLPQTLSPADKSLIDALAINAVFSAVLGLTGEEPIDSWTMALAKDLSSVLGTAHDSTDPHQTIKVDHLLSAPDAYEEVRWVVRSIAKHANEGGSFSRVGILYPPVGAYPSIVSNQLGMAGIPVAGPDPTLLRDTSAGKLLLLYMSMVESDYSRDAVTKWLSESPVKSSNEETSASRESSDWDVVSRKAGIVRGIDQWRDRLTRYAASLADRADESETRDESSPSSLRGMRQIKDSANNLAAFVERLHMSALPEDDASWSEFVDWALRVIKDYGPRHEEWPEYSKTSLDRILEILEDIRGLDEVSGPPGLSGFRLALEDALLTSAGRIGATGSGVFSAPISTALSMNFDLVYILGASEGALPRPTIDDPMLPDGIRQSIGQGNALRPISHQQIDERRQFLAALASATRRILTYPRTDPSARRGQHPSSWYMEAASVLLGHTIGSLELPLYKDEEWLTVIDSPADGLRLVDDIAPADEHDYDVASAARWRAAGHQLNSHYLARGGVIGRSLALEDGRRGATLSEWDGQLASREDVTKGLVSSADDVFSASRLERWASCPYRYFLGDVLGLSALDTPEEILTISPMDKGNLIHRILERFIGELIAHNLIPAPGDPWTDENRSLLTRIAREEFAVSESQGVTGKTVLWEATKVEVLNDLDAFLEDDERWRSTSEASPIWVERRFGFPNDPASLDAVTVDLGEGTEIRFRGVIDRVDSTLPSNKLIVTDYKSGSNNSYRDMKDDPLGSGRRLQLPIYAMAARQASVGQEDIESQYWFVSTAGRFEHKSIALSQVEDRFLEISKTIVSGIRSGLFPATPEPPGRDGKPANCSRCDFDRICPANRDVLWERKQGDPMLHTYSSLASKEGEPSDNE